MPVLFNQGVNEQQSVANSLHPERTRVQSEINKESMQELRRYAEALCDWRRGGGGEATRASPTHDELMGRVTTFGIRVQEAKPTEKNVEILAEAATLVRDMGGGRVTSCKSAKDRTSMSVTLEQARLVQAHHGLSDTHIDWLANVMREHGVRLTNCLKNIGKKRYAFNALQVQFLPKQFRPPKSTIGGGSSGTTLTPVHAPTEPRLQRLKQRCSATSRDSPAALSSPVGGMAKHVW